MKHLRLFTLGALALLSSLGPRLHAAADYSTLYSFTTLAGTSSIGSQDGTGAAARFYSPQDIAVDATGNAFVVDEGNHTIRKMTPAGVVTTFAGKPGEPGNVDGTGSAARFDSPQGIAIDSSGNLYVTDTGNHTIRKITSAGVVTTLAGLAGVTGNTDASGNAARFNRPRKIASDSSGNLYVTEAGNNAVRKITPTGGVTTFATNLKFPETQDIDALVSVAYGAIAVDTNGNVCVSAYEFTDEHSVLTSSGYFVNYSYIGFVHKLTPAGADSRLWETSITRTYDRQLYNAGVSALTFDSTGQLVATVGYQVVRYAPPADGSPNFVTLAGDGTIGGADGSATMAKLGFPMALTYDRSGNLLIADAGNNNVRKLSTTGTVSTVAGLALENAASFLDATGSAARLGSQLGVAVDAQRNVYIADTANHCIRKVTPAGDVTTLAGAPGQSGAVDGMGTAARFNGPVGLAVASSGILYVTDTQNHILRRVSPTGEVTTLAGTAGTFGSADGQGTDAQFYYPRGVTIGANGDLFVTDSTNATIRKVTATGEVSTFAGTALAYGTANGTGSAARFGSPQGIVADASGNLYVTDPGNHTIRKITSDGAVTTLGSATPGYADGSLAAARFNDPAAIGADASGNLYVADSDNQTIRKIWTTGTTAGTVSTLAGLVDSPGSTDGAGRDARFYYPRGIAVDNAGGLYVASGTTVRAGVLATGPTITTQPASQSVNAGANVTFSVTATGTPTPTYQWSLNGTALSGATGSSLTVSNVAAANAGDYTVSVTNAAGSVTSNKATLTVNTPAPTPTPTPAPSGGGGGAPSDWFAALVASALLIRAWRQARG
ncbi:MAG: immunoglobulin domain-containing protein [Candidatus Didemnitutus sp.]|nr:immunoglobulin domain-containing protein [Candidatus Didemnitutus sp.]